MKFDFLNLGPSILKSKISNELLLNINNYIDGLLMNGTGLDYSSNLAGQNTYQYIIEYDFVVNSGLEDLLLTLGKNYISKYEYDSNILLKDCWANISKDSDYNPIHVHSGMLSGILYLKTPLVDNNIDGHTQFIFGQQSLPFCNNTLLTLPEEGTILLFPSWLMHSAYPTKKISSTRRTISFNLGN